MIERDVENLCRFARKAFRLSDEDYVFSKNLLCGALRIEPADEPASEDGSSACEACGCTPEECAARHACGEQNNVDALLAPLVRHAIDKGIVTEEQYRLFDTYLISLFLPRPSSVIETFENDVKGVGTKRALANFYQFNIASNYIRMNDIRKNIVWDYEDDEGSIVVTINKSKPEKDNKEIAKLRSLPPSSYPKCMLCLENLGYAGRLNHPARENLRVIPLELCGETWYLQYSPYVYYNEHCIVFSGEHRPMTMDRSTFVKLAEFVERFPCYFLGSNACIPIVGGSILTHEHFQGGGYVMPMHRAAAREAFRTEDGFSVEIADWYNSVIRLTSSDITRLADACDEVNEKWKRYSNPELGILAETDQPHNAITPIVRKVGGNFVAELILRNNRTDETYPDGIFHAHPEYHNIKKEGIGLIEVMGLFILPGRLDAECDAVAACLAEKKPLPASCKVHKHMYDELKKTGPYEDVYDANKAIRAYVNRVCVNILKDTAVFKNDEAGREAFRTFVRSLDFVRE